ncbi:hypothetical protein GS501_05410 [Saccharibacter sp. 17.LH.SD]|uniref:glycine betaine ABC transporter substrate-binding protein n=1 Tax=Saccharibacter sp. 17.LH.SD TaxID=2689393 RepID=UPI00136FB8A3|nr:glycine betaine ABC transporter substrate-binding protein [Saccharibacter sp. 17.LH.SD]MXV44485.1 hypothetical protein [Saccharibacter sp. 17.LH.SD]
MTQLAIGHLYTALHAACASAVARVIEANGFDVSYVDLSVEEREEALANHEIDILVSAWMPRDHALISDEREAIGDLYQPQPTLAVLKDQAAGWDHAQTTIILTTEEARPWAEKYKASQASLQKISLEVVGESALIARVGQAASSGEKPLCALWQPHAIFHTDKLAILPETEALEKQSLSAQMVLRDGLRAEIDEDLLDELSIMMLGNRVMNALDYAVSVEEEDPEAAAEAWQRGRLLPR